PRDLTPATVQPDSVQPVAPEEEPQALEATEPEEEFADEAEIGGEAEEQPREIRDDEHGGRGRRRRRRRGRGRGGEGQTVRPHGEPPVSMPGEAMPEDAGSADEEAPFSEVRTDRQRDEEGNGERRRRRGRRGGRRGRRGREEGGQRPEGHFEPRPAGSDRAEGMNGAAAAAYEPLGDAPMVDEPPREEAIPMQPVAHEPRPEPAERHRPAAEPEPAEAQAEPAPPPAPQPQQPEEDPNRPKRGGWWQRRSFF